MFSKQFPTLTPINNNSCKNKNKKPIKMENSSLAKHMEFLDSFLLPFEEPGWNEVYRGDWNPLPCGMNPVATQYNRVAPGTRPIAVPSLLKGNITPAMQQSLAGLPEWPAASWWPEQDRAQPLVLVDGYMQPPFNSYVPRAQPIPPTGHNTMPRPRATYF
jgi:hypothetical protein